MALPAWLQATLLGILEAGEAAGPFFIHSAKATALVNTEEGVFNDLISTVIASSAATPTQVTVTPTVGATPIAKVS